MGFHGYVHAYDLDYHLPILIRAECSGVSVFVHFEFGMPTTYGVVDCKRLDADVEVEARFCLKIVDMLLIALFALYCKLDVVALFLRVIGNLTIFEQISVNAHIVEFELTVAAVSVRLIRLESVIFFWFISLRNCESCVRKYV